jgi:hypothetical protein
MNMETTWLDLSILSILNKFGICIFCFFIILVFLKFIFPKFINEHFTDKIHNLKYITIFCIGLALIILLISKIPAIKFISQYSITTFIYLFGVVILCSKLFFNK